MRNVECEIDEDFAVGRGLAPAVFCDTLTFFVSSGRGEFNERLPFEVAKRHEGLRKQLSVVFPRV